MIFTSRPKKEKQKEKKSSVRSRRMKKAYGVSKKRYVHMMKRQDGKCLICGMVSTNPWMKDHLPIDLFVDHCHTTGKVRGLLCHFCNAGLGFFRDNVENLANAINYLQKEDLKY